MPCSISPGNMGWIMFVPSTKLVTTQSIAYNKSHWERIDNVCSMTSNSYKTMDRLNHIWLLFKKDEVWQTGKNGSYMPYVLSQLVQHDYVTVAYDLCIKTRHENKHLTCFWMLLAGTVQQIQFERKWFQFSSLIDIGVCFVNISNQRKKKYGSFGDKDFQHSLLCTTIHLQSCQQDDYSIPQ